MTDIDLAALRAAAEAATPGPWGRVDHHVFGPTPEHSRPSVANTGWGDRAMAEPNAAYIAAANPAVVLALLDALEDEQWLRRSLEAQVADGDSSRTMRFGVLRAVLRTTRPMGLAETEEQP